MKNMRIIQTNGRTDSEYELVCDGDAQVPVYVLATIYCDETACLLANILNLPIN